VVGTPAISSTKEVGATSLSVATHMPVAVLWKYNVTKETRSEYELAVQRCIYHSKPW